MATGILGRKIGMTQVFDPEGNLIPVTVLQLGPNKVVQVKTADGKDGYDAIKVGFGEVKPSRVNRPDHGVFRKAGLDPLRWVREFRLDPGEASSYQVGQEIKVADLFKPGQRIDVTGTSKGKGYQGVIKRHGFKGAKEFTHGTHEYRRHGGSVGSSAWPSRVQPGKRMAGHMGDEAVTVLGLTVMAVHAEDGVLLVKGAVPGAKNGVVSARASTKANAWT